MICYLQDVEVSYFQAYIDGVDFVFMDSPMFRHMQKNIYGGNRMVGYLFLCFCYDWLIIRIIIIVMRPCFRLIPEYICYVLNVPNLLQT